MREICLLWNRNRKFDDDESINQ